MPTNLPEKAKAKWAEAIAAKDPKLKLRLLKEFYSSFPKHKGTEKLEITIKRQIRNLEYEIERMKAKRSSVARFEWAVKKEGIQLAVTGTLKAAFDLFSFLSGLQVKMHDCFLAPVVGSFQGATVRFQLVLAPLDPMLGEEKQERMMSLARNADAFLVALSEDFKDYVGYIHKLFEEHNIEARLDVPVELTITSSGGIRIVGRPDRVSERELREFLESYNIKNALLKVSKDATLDDVESAIYDRQLKPAFYVTTSTTIFERLRSSLPDLILLQRHDKDSFALHVLRGLRFIRVYTKPIGEEPVEEPLIVKEGSTMIEVAGQIHKDLARFFQFARVWRAGLPSGIKVGKTFILKDGDVVEIHAS